MTDREPPNPFGKKGKIPHQKKVKEIEEVYKDKGIPIEFHAYNAEEDDTDAG